MELANMNISQTVAILIDGNNIEISMHKIAGDNTMINFDKLVPKLIDVRSLNRLIYFREGKSISPKLAERLHKMFFGDVQACNKNADIQLTIRAVQLADKVDTIIIMSGDSDYIELVKHLRSRGIRVEIAAVKSTTSKALIEESDFFHEITEDDCFKYTEKKSDGKQ
jgi:uncharacterized LabA/DUF88 family protein